MPTVYIKRPPLALEGRKLSMEERIAMTTGADDPGLPWKLVKQAMMRVAERHLDINKSFGQQGQAAVFEVIKQICDQFPFFKQFENAWPIRDHLSRYWHRQTVKLSGSQPQAEPEQSSRLRRDRRRPARYPSSQRNPGSAQPEVNAGCPLAKKKNTGSTCPGAFRGFVSVNMEKRPRTAHGNTTNPPHSVEENPSVAHDGAAMAPIATQRVPVKENLALGVVERFLAGLDPPMHQGHLPILFRKLGVSGVKFDAMCRLADEERTEFLDRHLQPFISAIDLHILKCGFRKQAAHQCAGARDE